MTPGASRFHQGVTSLLCNRPVFLADESPLMTPEKVLPEKAQARSKALLQDAVFANKATPTLLDRLFAKWFEQMVNPQI